MHTRLCKGMPLFIDALRVEGGRGGQEQAKQNSRRTLDQSDVRLWSRRQRHQDWVLLAEKQQRYTKNRTEANLSLKNNYTLIQFRRNQCVEQVYYRFTFVLFIFYSFQICYKIQFSFYFVKRFLLVFI